jgi:transcriptional regulator with XRE-family HTH domain
LFMSQENCSINGDLLRLRREACGWVLNDMATRACMSVKQIRQLEEGGTSAFYSPNVKMTAAKKVGALLGLSAQQVLLQPDMPELDAHGHHEDIVAVESNIAPHVGSPGQVSIHVDASAETATPSASGVATTKSKTSLWVISGLFLAALGVAAYMQPEDEQPAEPAPPLQVVPSDSVDAASATESSPAASSAVVPAASANQAP